MGWEDIEVGKDPSATISILLSAMGINSSVPQRQLSMLRPLCYQLYCSKIVVGSGNEVEIVPYLGSRSGSTPGTPQTRSKAMAVLSQVLRVNVSH